MRHFAIWCALLALVACGEREASEPEATAPSPAASPTAEKATTPPPAAERDGGPPPAPPPLFPRGLIVHDAGVTDGYVLFNPLLSDTSYLVDNEGRVVHTWTSETSPGGGMYLLPSGNLLRTGRDPAMAGFKAGGTGGILQELDWDGNVVWEWRLSDEGHVQHHDVEPLPNGNLLVLAWEIVSPAEAKRAGRRPDLIPEQGLWPDWLLEIEPQREHGSGAKKVWEWHAWDHLIQDRDPKGDHYGDPAARPGRLDVNAGADAPKIGAAELAQLQALGYVPEDATAADLESDFLHTNAVAYNPSLDQIALSVPELGEVWIIDHGTTTEEARGPRGDLLYRFGNPSSYGRGERGDQRFFYQHDVRWVPAGGEGAGNLTVFNNGRERPEGDFSSIDEWTPPLRPDGRYALQDGEAYGPAELAWRFTMEEPTDFFSPFISGTHRLANGNTMICSGTGGRFLEVSRDGRVVWEYRNPFSGSVRNADGSMPQPGLEDSPFAVFRATRIPADHPGLSGRVLEPLEPQPAWHQHKEESP